MADHPQVHIELGDRQADVDEGIAPLIMELWKAEIDTVMSCQDNNGHVWVQFASAPDAEDFLDIVAGDYDEDVFSLYNRVTGEYEDDDWETFRAEHAWSYDCAPMDYNAALVDEDGEVEVPGPERAIVLHISVRFPHYDYDDVLARLRAHNAAADIG
ncbi:MAG TPA: hypothetical protein VM287_08775 [Egibacteraceae bacterium]|jgi:hypothetical protein|nr:hypothetical protein [Egibacteraceae bacterium]